MKVRELYCMRINNMKINSCLSTKDSCHKKRGGNKREREGEMDGKFQGEILFKINHILIYQVLSPSLT